MRWVLAAAVAGTAGLAVAVLAVGLLLAGGSGLLATACDPANPAGNAGPAVTAAGLPTGPVAGYGGAQLGIAAQILRAGADLGVGVRGQTIGVMVGMGESGLTDVMHGDAAGPDSIGVFQQRANGAWGTLADRTNPYVAATLFFRALLRVPGWAGMAPTLAAHRVQGNADPFYYARFWDRAVTVVGALAGTAATGVTGVTAGTGDRACTAQPPGRLAAGPGGWVRPVIGALTSGFGWRPATSVSPAELHAGQDIGAPCGTPIYAAAAGMVISSGPASGFGDWIRLDHGGTPDIVTVYGHMFPADLMVRVGDRVTAGQQISRVGRNGQATGCHLHVEVRIGGRAVDPVPFFAAHGAPLDGRT